ncbi:MAG: MGMT family protein [Verrucomicrobia bacterium]|nr:MGMT family protein [Verrucomicrobiota bacterium]
MVIIIGSKPGIRVQLHYEAGSLERVSLSPSRNFSLDPGSCPKDQVEIFVTWLKNYSQKKWSSMPLPLAGNTFQGEVLRFLQKIPLGSVLSYKEVAQGVGSPRAARAVGNICRGNLFPLFIPCHRVIRSDGGIGCYTPDPAIKRQLLHFEGVTEDSTPGACS